MPERKTVLIALVANVAIAVVKGVAGALSGSAAMLAEAAHSVADTTNQGFLLTSIHVSERRPDERHPFGYGKERFFWSFLAAVLIFLAGALFSAGEGVLELTMSPGKTSYAFAWGALGFAFVAESISLARAVRQTRREAREAGKGWREYIRESTEPTAKTVVGEDTVAVAGVLIAAAGIGLHELTGNAAWDAAAALCVGAMLVYVAFVLGRNFKELLIGAGARPEEVDRIREVVEREPGVDALVDLQTMYVGPRSLLVALRADLVDGIDADRIERLANELDRKLREAVPEVSEVFLDPTPRSAENVPTLRR
jgi:cation diffusion facilitator family transporter